MKIAAATNDGNTIAADFESAAYYTVLIIESGLIAGRELRAKRPLGWYRATGHAEHHGPAAAAPETAEGHDTMIDPIDDCDAILVSGIEPQALSRLEAAGIWPVVVPPGAIDEAALNVLAERPVGT